MMEYQLIRKKVDCTGSVYWYVDSYHRLKRDARLRMEFLVAHGFETSDSVRVI